MKVKWFGGPDDGKVFDIEDGAMYVRILELQAARATDIVPDIPNGSVTTVPISEIITYAGERIHVARWEHRW